MNDYNNEKRIIEQMKESLDEMDHIEFKVPEMNYFRNLVSRVDEKQKSKSRKEFILFFMIALTLLGSFTFACYKYSIVFMAIQAMSLLFIPAGLYAWFRKQRKQVV